jgi:hypothetical protein
MTATYVQPASVYDARVYGAKGTGDDTTPIQNTINAAATNGGTVFFYPGTYSYSTLTIPVNANLVFAGAGNGSSTLKQLNGQSSNGFVITGAGKAGRLVFQDLKFDGNQANQNDRSKSILSLSVDTLTVDRCYFTNSLHSAIELMDFNAAWISKSIFTNMAFGAHGAGTVDTPLPRGKSDVGILLPALPQFR